ncbi:hypothetical protein Taro_034714, partial [Colocasia esculenta]|nr:hypothetical protein [Colocasia esculenta]
QYKDSSCNFTFRSPRPTRYPAAPTPVGGCTAAPLLLLITMKVESTGEGDGGRVLAGPGAAAPPPPAMAPSSPSLRQAMVLPAGGDDSEEKGSRRREKKQQQQLTLIPLIFLIYFEVSGGPYGEEPAVQAAGPFLAILGFLIFPFIWSIPEALITAELATAFPGNGGYVVWATEAFGPFAGSLMGSWKYLSGVINNAAYPVLCADYLSRIFSRFSGGAPRDVAIAGFTLGLSFLNYTGLTVVGWAAVALGAVSLAPFAVMAAAAAPKVRPGRWLGRGETGAGRGRTDWSLYLNTLFWNLNFWDNASTLAGEVERPQRTFPRALLGAGLLTCIGYLVPLLAGTGALDVPRDQWTDGFLADAAGMIMGKWLKIWVEVGAVLSAVGLYEAQLSSSSFQLLGMADLGLLPRAFAARARWFRTPWLAIVVSTVVTLSVSFMSFDNIIASTNFLYSLGMLLEFASFLWLRWKRPGITRPFRVPLRLPGLVIMCLVPSGFLVFVMVVGTWQVYAIGAGLTALGIAIYHAMRYCKSKGWFEFTKVVQEDKEEEERDEGEDKEERAAHTDGIVVRV